MMTAPSSYPISLFPSGQDQIVTIPHEFALPGTEVWLKEDDRLIMEPIRPGSLLTTFFC